jgi:P22 coat protein - gene protein 5
VSNSLVTCSIVAKESLAILKNMLGFAANVNTDFQAEFTGNQSRGYSPGQTINIKRPPRFTYRAGRVSVPQATTETTVPLTLSQGGCDLGFTGLERAVSVQQLEQKIMAAVATVANEIDRQGLDLAHFAAFNTLGTIGTVPATQAAAIAAITQVNQRLDEMGAPRDRQRALILNPAMNAGLIQGMAGLFNSQDKITKQFGSGMLVDSLGLSYAMDQNVVNHTNGAATATNVNGANQTGASVTVVAVAGGTLTKGSVITLPGVFAVNPQSRQSTGTLAQFIVTADVLVGATSIPISPSITPSGAFQNVTASPTSGSPYVIFGTAGQTYACNVGYHRDAFTLAMVPMDAPMAAGGVDVSVMSDQGLSVKVTKYYDPINDYNGMRLDVLFGWAAPYPELACKIVA